MTIASKRVAILGGGIGALSAAFEITRTPGFDVTIHTLGWRLGGKCASSRGPDGRIEEHGIHGYLGCYYNAMPMLAAVYAELAREPMAPLPTFESAIRGMDSLQMYSWQDGVPTQFAGGFPANKLFPDPANPGTLLDIESLIQRALAWVEALQVAHADHPQAGFIGDILDGLREIVAAAIQGLSAVAGLLLRGIEALWHAAKHGIRALIGDDPQKAQIYTIIDWAFTLFRGVLADDVALKGFDYLDDENWADWLARHGADPETIVSPIALNTVNLAYQYPEGDTLKKPRMAAGAYAHWSLRALGYCGHAIYAFSAGTGEVVIAPMYDVLLRRGVKFEFFSKVAALHLNTAGTDVESVEIGMQATLKPAYSRYDPLIHPAGLPSWPSAPLYDQLVEGDALKAGGYDLESWWTAWPTLKPNKVIRAGTDYDVLVFALSVGAVPHVCGELLDKSAAWRDMVAALPVLQTQAMQIWLSKSYVELGFTPALTGNDTALADTYAYPLDGHCEMRHLLSHEAWPADNMPQSLWYFCDLMADPELPPPFSDHGYPARVKARVRQTAIDFLNKHIGPLMPLAINSGTHAPGDPRALDYSLLVDTRPVPGEGEARFDSQFIRANIDPTERYVASPPGSTKYRLRPWQSGFGNLVLAGDWTYTGLNVGSVECATMSGQLASHAITGAPALADIAGYPAALDAAAGLGPPAFPAG